MARELQPDELAAEQRRQEHAQQAQTKAMSLLIQIRINLAGGIIAHVCEVDYARALHQKKAPDPADDARAADFAVRRADALMVRLGLVPPEPAGRSAAP